MKNLIVIFLFLLSYNTYSQGLSFSPTVAYTHIYQEHPKYCIGLGVTFSSLYAEFNKSITKNYGNEVYYSYSGEDTTKVDDVFNRSVWLGIDIRTYSHNLYIRPKVGCIWGEKIHKMDNNSYYLGKSDYRFNFGIDCIYYFNYYVGVTIGISKYEYFKASFNIRIPNKKYAGYRYIYF